MKTKPPKPLIGLDQARYHKAAREFVDVDYASKLNAEDQLYLSKFLNTYYDNNVDADSYCDACRDLKPKCKARKQCQDPICLRRKETFTRTNRSHSDVTTNCKTTPLESWTETGEVSPEDAWIDEIDANWTPVIKPRRPT